MNLTKPTLDEIREGAAPELAAIGSVDPGAYRRSLIETLIEVWKLCMQHPAARFLDPSAAEKFRSELKTLPLADLEKRVMALEEQNPEVLAAAMKKSGFKFTHNADGMRIELADDNPTGRVVTREEFEAL